MATGYIVSGRGDLDILFKPRVSATAAATGFLSNGGVDLNQRFEPRGSTTPIAATNYVAGSTDLASIFMDAGALTPLITRTFTMGNNSGVRPGWFNPDSGYAQVTGQTLMSPSVPEWSVGGVPYRLDLIDLVSNFLSVQVSNPTSAPIDSDGVWSFMSLTGIFASSGGATVTRTITRSSRDGTSPGGSTPNGRPRRQWTYNSGSAVGWDIIGPTPYTLVIG